jgi:hypothetical protein
LREKVATAAKYTAQEQSNSKSTHAHRDVLQKKKVGESTNREKKRTKSPDRSVCVCVFVTRIVLAT